VATTALALLAVGCGNVSPVASVAPGHVVTVPAWIDASGATDVTTPLQAFLVSVPDNSTVVFPPGSKYRAEETLKLIGRHNLNIEGTGSTVFATTEGDRNRAQFLIRTSTNLRIHGLEVVGAHPNAGTSDEAWVESLEAQHAFRLEGVHNVDLDAVKAHDVYGDFVNITRDTDSKAWSDGVWIHDSTFARNGRMGISITDGRNIVIERNSLSDSRRSTIDMEPNVSSGGAEYVRIDRNRIYGGRLNFVSAGKTRSTRSNDVHDIVITNNVLKDHILNVFVATRASANQRRANFTVVGNTSDKPANGVAPLRFTDVDNVRVQNNRQPTKKVPVTTNGCTGVVVTGNLFGL
jgi:hypothetical protein